MPIGKIAEERITHDADREPRGQLCERHPRNIDGAFVLRLHRGFTRSIDQKRKVGKLRLRRTIEGLGHIGKSEDAHVESRFLTTLAHDRRIARLERFLAPTGQIPKRFAVICVAARDEQDAAVAFEDAGAKMDALPGHMQNCAA